VPEPDRPAVLISEPSALENPRPFLPYVWAILKSYWERHGEDAAAFDWLPPLFRNEDPDVLLRPLDGRRIDVLGLSCYTWNWELQCGLARRVKAANPGCLVVAGGPEPDYKDPGFFRKHPYIDAIAVKDGEITFSRILSGWLRGARDLREVPGLYLPGAGDGPVGTGPAEVPTVFDHSPYADQAAFYEALARAAGPDAFGATWETNRGCPYSCSFCDWGSSTLSKVRRFDMGRVEADVEMLGRLGVAFVFAADANFGILARDVEIADLLCAVRRKHGHPRTLYYSAAKNNPDRALEIARRLAQGGLSPTHTLAIQHTRKEVLAATDRANISPDKQVQVAQSLMESGIPVSVQLILGIPGDTTSLWKECLADLMEWGIHEDYDTYFYSLLPNAPAAEPEFLARWEVGALDRIVLSDTSQPWKPGLLDRVRMTKSRIVVRSKTYSSRDWVQMFTYVAFVKALHNGSLTRLVALYLRLTHGVPYREFYEDLIEGFLPSAAPGAGWHEAVTRCYATMLEEEDAMDRMRVAELPGYPYALDPSRWVYVQACRAQAAFFAALEGHLRARHPGARHLASVIDYQRELVILPDYDRRKGKTFRTDLDWPSYFARARGRRGRDPLGEPEAMPGAVIEVDDQSCGEKGFLVQPLDWETREGEERWVEWLKHTVLNRNSSGKKNHQQLKVVMPGFFGRLKERARAMAGA
jgi:putative methyltransferase